MPRFKLKVHSHAKPFFCTHTLCMSYILLTNTFLLVNCSVWSKQLLCFLHRQGQKHKQKPTTKKFVRFHNHSPILTMLTIQYLKGLISDKLQLIN